MTAAATTHEASRLHRLLNPASVAVVGASERSPWTFQIVGAFKQYQFAGQMYMVNRRGGTVFGHTAYESCSAIGKPIDVAIIAIPAEAVLDAVKDAAAAGIRNAVILTSGFAELGEAGAVAQKQIADVAREHDMLVFGPNSLGFYNAAERVSVTTMRSLDGPLSAGGVSLVSQSGSIAMAMAYFAQQQQIGLRWVIAMGNEAMVDSSEVIEYLIADEKTKAIVLFAETIRNADGFRRAAELARQARKPLVVLKVGRSELTNAVAQAHTGALVGDDRVFDSFCQQYAVIRVDSMEEALVTADLIAAVGPLSKPGIGVVSISGGACELLADAGAKYGVQYPGFTSETQEKLRSLVSAYGATHNPFDITGAAVTDPGLFERILPVVSADENVGLTLAVMELVKTGDMQNPILESIARGISKMTGPGLLVNQLVKAIGPREQSIIESHGIPKVVSSLEWVSQALGRLTTWSRRLSSQPAPHLSTPASDVWPSLDTEPKVLAHLSAYGVPVVPGILCTSAQEAAEAVRAIGGDQYVLKIVSSDIQHKTEVGGVRLRVSPAAIEQTYREVIEAAGTARPDACIDGVLVTPMRDSGIELFVGTARDPVWGPVIVAGLGGIWVEALKDTALRLLPVTREEAHDMLRSLRASRLLQGYRGAPAVDLNAVVEVIVRIGEAALALGPELASLEVNPLLANGAKVEALDGLVVRGRMEHEN
jgi:acetate---CoA ligase (ADP-forming)